MLNVPKLFDETGNPKFEEKDEKISGAFSPLMCNKQEAMDILANIASKQPTRPVFDIWYSYFRSRIGLKENEDGKMVSAEVCPIGFLTEEIEDYVSMENAASKYNSLPFPGNWLDQPLYIIEAFENINVASGHYERDKSNKMKSKAVAEERKAKSGR